MNVYRFDPFNEFDRLRGEFNRLLGGLESSLPRDLQRPLSALRGDSAAPRVNVREDDNAYHVEAVIPGVEKDSLDIQVLGKRLTIVGEKPAPVDVKPEDYHRNERSTGRFARTVTLPSEIDPDAVAADYQHGILTVTLPKSEAAKPRKISIATS